MSRLIPKSRFESEVHLGFMVIVLLLLSINFVSNYFLFTARSEHHEEVTAQLYRAGVVASRAIQSNYPNAPGDIELDDIKQRFNLSELTTLPLKPADDTELARRIWFRSVLRLFPPGEYPRLADRLHQAELKELTRGEGSEYYLLYPIPSGAGNTLLLMATKSSQLAYLDDSRSILGFVLGGALVVVAVAYALLSGFIFKPFRRISQKAREAGRLTDATANETEALVSDYEAMIAQLKHDEAELVRLNREIKGRADFLEELNHCLVRSAQAGVITVDRGGQVMAINDAAERLLELQTGGWIGEPVESMFSSHPKLRSDIAEVLESGTGYGYREYDEHQNVVGAICTFLTDHQNERRALLITLNDLSEVSRLRTELESRQRLAALGEMAAGLAHQVRNSLGAISGYATLVKKRVTKAGLETNPVEAILGETDDAGDLITRFLDFARPLDLSLERLEIGDLLNQAADQFRAGVNDPNWIKLDGALDCEIEGDRLLLKQAIANLIDNGLRAAGDKPADILLEATKGGKKLLLRVVDRGCGIPAESIDNIFTPFFSSRASGSGLGLPLAAKIIGMHHGSISLETSSSAGTAFLISLPLEVEPGIETAPSESAVDSISR